MDDLTYWKTQLADAPEILAFPIDRLTQAQCTHQSAQQDFNLSTSLSTALNAVSEDEEATLLITLLTAFQILLFRYSGQADICIGSPILDSMQSKDLTFKTLALRTDLSGDPTFRELLRRVRRVTLEAIAHQQLAFEDFVQDLQRDGKSTHLPVFRVMFSLGETSESAIHLPDLAVRAVESSTRATKVDLFLSISKEDDRLSAHVIYDTGLFDTNMITRMLGHLQSLLQGIIADPDQRISVLPLLTQEEKHQLLFEWNNTKNGYSCERCVHELIEAQTQHTPDAIAVICEDEQLTYDQLNRRANKLARFLAEEHVEAGVLVALLAERSIDFLITLLAILKAGGVYVPLDPEHPAKRHYQVLSQSGCTSVITMGKFKPLLAQAIDEFPLEKQPHVLQLETLLTLDQSEENLPSRCSIHDAAYVMFTSGSTGVPKGAMIEHLGMLNHIYGKISDTQISSVDIVAQNGPQCFDISVWQYLAALILGGRVLIFKDEIAHDPAKLLREVERGAVTILQLVPSMLREIVYQASSLGDARPTLSALRWVIPTGDALTADLTRQWLMLYPSIPLLNTYGATETSDDTCHYAIYEPPPSDYRLSIMPVGRPIPNTQAYVLDHTLSPVPVGVVGEIYLGGICVGRGYLNDQQRTAQSFIPDPFNDEPNARIYKTGDLARYMADGTLEFLGRIDHQIKIHGHRIELGEIEMALKQHPSVMNLVVIARKESTGDQRLVAYVVLHTDHLATTENELQNHLLKQLPSYMVPSAIVFLEALPLNSNGKIDRRQLPLPESTRPEVQRQVVAPRNSVEEAVVASWSSVLGIQQISIYDDFFMLGGDSLLATRVTSILRTNLEVEIPLRSFFESPTVAQLAEIIMQLKEQNAQSQTPTLRKLSRQAYRLPEASLSLTRDSSGYLN
jgi:amino acid adenylation domain-containing protein